MVWATRTWSFDGVIVLSAVRVTVGIGGATGGWAN